MASSARIDELRKKFDDNPRRYFAPLANEYRKAGDPGQAIFICEAYLPQQPGHMSGHIVFGQALYELGRLDEARGVFETALSLDPENLIALRHLGDVARQTGDVVSARRWYERVLEADPRNEEIAQIVASLANAQESPPPADASAPSRADTLTQPIPAQFAAGRPTTPHAAITIQDLARDLAAEANAESAAQPAPEPVEPPAAEPPPIPVEASEEVSVFEPPPIPNLTLEPAQPRAPRHSTQLFDLDEVTLDGVQLTPSSIPAQPDTSAPETPETAVAQEHANDAESAGFEADPLAAAAHSSGAIDAGPLPMFEAAFADLPPEDIDARGSSSAETVEIPALGGSLASEITPADEPEELTFVEGVFSESLEVGVPVADWGKADPDAHLPSVDESFTGESMASTSAAFMPEVLDHATDDEPPAVVWQAADASMWSAPPDEPEVAAESTAPEATSPETTSPGATVGDAAGEGDHALESSNATSEPAELPAHDSTTSAPPEAFVTETMAELYLEQGHLESALDIYRKLVEQRPDEPQLQERLGLIERRLYGPSETEAVAEVESGAAPEETGPTIREFLAFFAGRGSAAQIEHDAGVAAQSPDEHSWNDAVVDGAEQVSLADVGHEGYEAYEAAEELDPEWQSDEAVAEYAQEESASLEGAAVGDDLVPVEALAPDDELQTSADETLGEESITSAAAGAPVDEPHRVAHEEIPDTSDFAYGAAQYGAAAEEVEPDAAESFAADPGDPVDFAESAVAVDAIETPPGGANGPTVAPEAWSDDTSGSIDELFGGAVVSESDEFAAAELAAVFAPETDSADSSFFEQAASEPAAPAPDHVMTAAPEHEPAPAAPAASHAEAADDGFSFDQFFAGDVQDAAPTAPREADVVPGDAADVAQFNQWLNRLKKT